MIVDSQRPHWQQAMKLAIRDADSLCRRLGIEKNRVSLSSIGEKQFPVFVPLEFVSRMKAGDPHDPLLLQVLPHTEESKFDPEFSTDPVGDSEVEAAPGLLHKYEGRVLLVLSGVCAIHCRYCFRRHYPYETAPKSFERWLPALEYIRNDPSIHEVILSGGDPLTLVDSQLATLVRELDTIPHLTRLRIHTRLPVVIPQRIDDELCGWLTQSRLSKWMVLHINHRQEIDEHLAVAIRRIQQTGTVVLNQSVLLKGVNDSPNALEALCRTLVDCGVTPYYLHQLDRVQGAAHFEVDPASGIEMASELMSRLPGYAVPKFVVEIAGQKSKTPMGSHVAESMQ